MSIWWHLNTTRVSTNLTCFTKTCQTVEGCTDSALAPSHCPYAQATLYLPAIHPFIQRFLLSFGWLKGFNNLTYSSAFLTFSFPLPLTPHPFHSFPLFFQAVTCVLTRLEPNNNLAHEMCFILLQVPSAGQFHQTNIQIISSKSMKFVPHDKQVS